MSNFLSAEAQLSMRHVSCRLAASDSQGHATTSLLVLTHLSFQDTKGRPCISISTSDPGI